MATLTKARAHKPVMASAMVSCVHSCGSIDGDRIGIMISDNDYRMATHYLNVSAIEAGVIAGAIAGYLTFDASKGTVDRRSVAARLRAMADRLEAEK